MAIKKFVVNFTRQYVVVIDEKATDEYVIKQAQSQLNSDLGWELDVVRQFKVEIVKDNECI